ncbi:MAG: hypothetical protein KF819_05805 [Labilithrix sp.]|nr:hypothetical protein [Labilithrix sp.]
MLSGPLLASCAPATRINGAPVAVNAPAIGEPDATTGAVKVDLGLEDPDGDRLTYTSDGKGDVATNPDGTLLYTPTAASRAEAAATEGPDVESVTFTANDGNGHATTVTVDIPIRAAAGPEIVQIDVGTPDASAVVRGAIHARHSDGDPLRFDLASPPLNGALTFDPPPQAMNGVWIGNFVYRPTAEARERVATGTGPTEDHVVARISDGDRAVVVRISVQIAP